MTKSSGGVYPGKRGNHIVDGRYIAIPQVRVSASGAVDSRMIPESGQTYDF